MQPLCDEMRHSGAKQSLRGVNKAALAPTLRTTAPTQHHSVFEYPYRLQGRQQRKGIGMTVFNQETEQFIQELDSAMEAHMAWSRKILRCAVLKESPDEDVLASDAHKRCRFGKWATQYRAQLTDMDAVATEDLCLQHEHMHNAIRTLCTDIMGVGLGQSVDLEAFERTQAALVARLASFKTTVLSQSARIDPLTGLALRYGLEAEYLRCLRMAERDQKKTYVLLIDIDHFKRVNDVHGHAVGDRALQQFAGILKRQARAGDSIFRFGGEEFLVLIQAEKAEDAAHAAHRLLDTMRNTPLPITSSTSLTLTASAGLASVEAGDNMADAVHRADTALYQAKAQGRDQWLWADSEQLLPAR